MTILLSGLTQKNDCGDWVETRPLRLPMETMASESCDRRHGHATTRDFTRDTKRRGGFGLGITVGENGVSDHPTILLFLQIRRGEPKEVR